MPTLLLDRLNYFALADETFDEDSGVLSAVLVKSQGTILDRETERILTDGGLYAFQVIFTITSPVSPELGQVIAPVHLHLYRAPDLPIDIISPCTQ